MAMNDKNVCLHFSEEENSQLKFVMHEIHASLRSINMALSQINDRNLSTPAGRQHIKEMAEIALGSSSDINNQLDYWQISNDSNYFKDAVMHPQNLWWKFSKPNAYFTSRMRAANIDYRVEKVGTDIITDYYGYGIVNALANIMLDNAIKYSPVGGEILCEFQYDTDGSLIISMENSGPYVSPDEVSTLFQCGIRGKNASIANVRGNGYGLNFLDLIVRAHNGSVEIDTEYTGTLNGIKYGQFKVTVTLAMFEEDDDEEEDEMW